MAYSTRFHFRTKAALLLAILLSFLLSIGPAQAKEQDAPQAQTDNVSIVVNPATNNAEVGDTFIVTIQVQAGSAEVNGVSAYLDFDPAVLQVQAMTPVTAFPVTLSNTFDNNNGQINYAVASFGSYPTGTFDLLQVELQAIANSPSSTLAFQSVNPRQTDVTSPGVGSNLTGSTDGTIVVGSTVSVEADFTCTPTSGESPLTVTCTDQSTGDITSRSWDFGDGASSNEQNPTHTYNTDGTYTVALSVTGAGGSDTESGYISVSSSSIITTTLQVEPSYVEMYVGQSINLTLAVEETEKLYGLEVTCTTDANVLPLQDATFIRGDFFGTDALEGINELSQNSWHGALSQKYPAPVLSGDGDFATLTVSAIAAGTVEVHCTPLGSNEDGFALPFSALHSTITILEPPIGISGLSTYQSRQNHAGIQVSATGPTNQITTTLETGRFELPELSFGSYEIKAETPGHLYNCIDNVQAPPGGATVLDPSKLLAGDVNGDHKINIFDATAVTNIFGQAPAPQQPTDFNADGIVDILDLTPLGRNFNGTRLDSDNNPICTGW